MRVPSGDHTGPKRKKPDSATSLTTLPSADSTRSAPLLEVRIMLPSGE